MFLVSLRTELSHCLKKEVTRLKGWGQEGTQAMVDGQAVLDAGELEFKNQRVSVIKIVQERGGGMCLS